MWDNIVKFFKNLSKKEQEDKSKRAAKERLHLVLMQDRANVSADFLELMKQEIIDVIKKYIEVNENEIDVRLTNKTNSDGTTGAPALYANIPIMSLKTEAKKASNEVKKEAEIKKEEEKKVEEKVPKKRGRKPKNADANEDNPKGSKTAAAKAATKAAINKMTSKIKSIQK